MLEDTGRIDMVAEDRDGKVMLVITDAGTVENPDQRFTLLAEKMKTYVGFVTSEAFARRFPGRTPGDVTIHVMCSEPPTDRMMKVDRVAPGGKHDQAINVTFQHLP